MLKNKNLTREELNHIMQYSKLYKGGESIICEGKNEFSVIKLFAENGTLIPMSDNKEKKLNLLYQMNPDYSTKVLSTISCNGTLVGFEQSSNPDYITLKQLNIMYFKDMLYQLRKIKEILEYFSSIGIIYGDLALRNILINTETGELVFCDMDNTQIDDYKMDLVPSELYEYKELRGIDFGVHPYQHNNLLLRALYEDIYTIAPRTIRRTFKRPARKIIDTMLTPEFYTDEYLIDHIKKLNR